MTDSTWITIGATFASVFVSFLLWFGGSALIKRREERKRLKVMMQALLLEIKFNVAILIPHERYLRKCMEPRGDVAMLITQLKYSAAQYAVSSGEVRLIRHVRKRRIVEYAAFSYEAYNRFAENTERLLATLLLRDDGLVWAKHRVKAMAEQAASTRSVLEGHLSMLEDEDLPEDEGGDEMSKPVDQSQLSNEEKILGQLEENNRIIVQMSKNQKRNSWVTLIAIVLAIWAIALAIKTEDPSGAFGLFFIGLLVLIATPLYPGEKSEDKEPFIKRCSLSVKQFVKEPKQLLFATGCVITFAGILLLVFSSSFPIIYSVLIAFLGIVIVELSAFIPRKKHK